MKVFILFLLILLLIKILFKIEKFLEYNPNKFTQYHKVKVNKKYSERDFNTDSISYYKYPYKCVNYADIIVNS